MRQRCGRSRIIPALAAGGLALSLALPAGAQPPSAGKPLPPTPPIEPDSTAFTPLPPPSLNFYGSAGLLDMPSAEMLPDGQYTTTVSYFGNQGRLTITFQATPWLSASFRYNGINNWNLGGFATYYDRGFDVRFRLLQETARRPGITLGLQDFVGTGIYAAEYIVATKSFETPGWRGSHLPGRLKLTGGLGWGRLGSHGSIGSYGVRPPFDPNGTGGQLSYDQWFRGPFAPFAGIEWTPNDRWGLKAEYSSDAYVVETQTTSVFQRKSPFNFGVEYQAGARARIGAYYMYGSEFGLTLQFQMNPYHPVTALRVPAPRPIRPRPDRTSSPAAWGTGWSEAQDAAPSLRDRLAPLLEADGLILDSLHVSAHEAELRYRNARYLSYAQSTGRAARAMAQVMPASVETFRLVPVAETMGLSATIIRRSDLEALEFHPMAAPALQAVTGFADAAAPPSGAGWQSASADLYPEFETFYSPYFSPSYFDPDKPIRMDVGIAFGAVWRPAPGWVAAGTIRQRLFGNVKDGRLSNSVLPRVRTDQTLYAQASTTLNNLFASRFWRPGRDLYARASFGYFEAMFGGLSGELLWKRVGSPLALGLELNYVRQRDYDQRLGFRDYSVATGHASAYLDLGGGYLGQVDVGRYLAGDVGATFSLDRTFDNGWSVGGFFTLTNVSATDFGEGSFDKGVRFSIPVGWFLGTPSARSFGTTIRPVQRDGGQRLEMPGRLYGVVRNAHRTALDDQWARVWE